MCSACKFARLCLLVCFLLMVQSGGEERLIQAAGEENTRAVENTTPEPMTANVLTVAADPNNLPFSNIKEEGFENEIAAMVASELRMKLEYVWRAQRRGFFRETLKAQTADLVMGVPAGFEMATTTRPYYRSSYAFVTRQNKGQKISSFDEALLHQARIGVQIVGDDGFNTPPAHAFARRGIVTNLVGFTLYGDYKQANPPARILEALAAGEIDVAVVWAPLAGYFTRQIKEPLQLSLIENSPADAPFRFAFSIAMGVRRGNSEFKNQLDEIIARRQGDIDAILDKFGIPRLPMTREKARER